MPLPPPTRKSSITSTDGNPTEKDGGKTKRRDSIRRESNVSCSSWTEDSYTDYESDDDVEGVSPRGRNQKASNGFGDFCVRNIQMWKFGRHEIEFAENEMEGLIKLRDKVDKSDQTFFHIRIRYNILWHYSLHKRLFYPIKIQKFFNYQNTFIKL